MRNSLLVTLISTLFVANVSASSNYFEIPDPLNSIHLFSLKGEYVSEDDSSQYKEHESQVTVPQIFPCEVTPKFVSLHHIEDEGALKIIYRNINQGTSIPLGIKCQSDEIGLEQKKLKIFWDNAENRKLVRDKLIEGYQNVYRKAGLVSNITFYSGNHLAKELVERFDLAQGRVPVYMGLDGRYSIKDFFISATENEIKFIFEQQQKCEVNPNCLPVVMQKINSTVDFNDEGLSEMTPVSGKYIYGFLYSDNLTEIEKELMEKLKDKSLDSVDLGYKYEKSGDFVIGRYDSDFDKRLEKVFERDIQFKKKE